MQIAKSIAELVYTRNDAAYLRPALVAVPLQPLVEAPHVSRHLALLLDGRQLREAVFLGDDVNPKIFLEE